MTGLCIQKVLSRFSKNLLLLSMRHSWIIKTYLELVQVLKTTSQLSSHDKMRTIATATKVLQCSKHAMTWTTVTG